jgi:CDGSH-type Zn-finger protein/uncharacterized Fe-S cluster protein YjdI
MSSGIEEVRGKKAIVRFEAAKCIHSRNCVLDRPDVFVPNVQGEWIKPDNGTPEALLRLALNCPSGAISVERLDGSENETPPLVNTARVRENGPLAVHGELAIAGQEASLRATLCRCGQSQNKPFCDGSHTAAGFQATGEPKMQESVALARRNGALKVLPLPNGPLKIHGALEIVSGTGHTINRVMETYLCRCGGSANKPYCDGTHAKIGFKAP